MSWIRKAGYVLFISGLTASAMTACYWQSNRYLQARKRWDTINKELSKESPDHL